MNAEIRIIEIQSLQQFIQEVSAVQQGGFEKIWFRGIADHEYGLEPSIYRKSENAVIEKQLMNRFKSKALPFIEDKNMSSYWEWLFIMQHYGVPTRLLDWSESALVSLAFAVIYRENHHNGHDAGLWCLDPIKLNRDFVKGILLNELIPSITDKTVKKIQTYEDENIPAEYPIAIYGPLNSTRIVAQKGVFTLFPFIDKFKLEDLPVSHNFLVKFVIKEAHIEQIKNELITMGITENSIYPGLDSIAKEINREILSI